MLSFIYIAMLLGFNYEMPKIGSGLLVIDIRTTIFPLKWSNTYVQCPILFHSSEAQGLNFAGLKSSSYRPESIRENEPRERRLTFMANRVPPFAPFAIM